MQYYMGIYLTCISDIGVTKIIKIESKKVTMSGKTEWEVIFQWEFMVMRVYFHNVKRFLKICNTTMWIIYMIYMLLKSKLKNGKMLIFF